LVIGIKESAILNNVFTAVNLTVIAIVIIVGLTKIHGHNWNISPDEVY
jgi:amino acid transporter